MKTAKKIICVIAIVSLIIAAIPLNFAPLSQFGIKAAAESSSLALSRPKAGMSVTEVTRVAYAVNTMKPPSDNNSAIVKATPSGIPYLSSSYSSKIYAGETPQATQISFTPGVELSEAPVISCNNSTVQFSNYVLSGGTYTWTVTSGTATAGTTLIFTVSYSYSEENTITGKTYTRNYQTQAISYVESILVPAGIYSTRRTYENFVVGSSTKNRSYIASFLLGKNVYGGIYNNGKGDGCIDFSSTSWYSSNNWTSEYGNMMNFGESGSNREYNVSFGADSSRPISYVYFDRSMNFTLSDINLRFCTLLPNQASEVDERVTVSLEGVYPQSGIVQTFSDDSDEETPPFDITAKNELGIGNYTGSIKTIGSTFTLPFSGNGPSSSRTTADYSVAVKYQTAAQWTGIYIGHSFSLRILTYDKGRLRELVEQIQNTDPVSVTTEVGSDEFKGYNPQSWYYSTGYEGFLTAFNAAKACLAKPDVSQSDINTAYNNLVVAYGNLKLAKADYSAAEIYYNRAREKNQSDYTISSWAKLQTAMENYHDDYSILYQPAIDKMVIDIAAALRELEYKRADYSGVLMQLLRVNNLMENAPFDYGYTADKVYENWDSLQSVLKKSGCVYNELDGYTVGEYLPVSQQSTVDGYATLIKNATDVLSLKKADYTYAGAAESAYSILNLSYVIDDIAAELTEKYLALFALHELDISHQREIDNAADELYYWLDRVQYKPADTKAAKALIAYARTISEEQYGDISSITKAIDNLNSRLTLDIRYQSEIDRYTSALQSAIDKLITNAADYTLVDEAIQNVNAIAKNIAETYEDSYGFTAADFYSNWADVETAVSNVVRKLDNSQQSTVNAFANAINTAVSRLVENSADYAEATPLIARAEDILGHSYLSSKYTSETVSALQNAYLAMNLNLKISSQAVVDAQTADLSEALDGLVYIRANYTNVNMKISAANEKIAQNDAYNELHQGYSYFTPESLSALNIVLASVTDDLDITMQSTVDGYATAIQNAMDALEYGAADYTQVDLALAAVPEDLSVYTTLSVTVMNNLIKGINRDLKANNQLTVDNYVGTVSNAIGKLKYKNADYSQVDAALARIPSDLSIYTEESRQILSDAQNAVIRGLDITQQETVDGFAQAINSAIDYLVIIKADYTCVTEAIRAVPSELDNYTDETAEAVTIAVHAVVYELDITHQNEVNAFAQAITNAVAALEAKSADYTLAAAAIEAAVQKIATNYYTEESVAVLQSKISALVRNLDIFHQSEVDEQTENIVKATNELVLKSADYTELQKILDLLDNPESEIYNNRYSNFDEVVSAISEYREKTVSQNMNLTIDKQNVVDEMTAVIQGYIDSLVPAAVIEPKDGSTTVISEIDGVNYIYGLDTGLTEQELIDNYICCGENASIEFEYCDNQTVGIIGTATKIIVKSTVTGKIDGTYTVLIYGDVNGDGECDATDSICVSCIAAEMLDENQIGKARYLAADCNHSGTADDTDAEMLSDISLYGGKIEQQPDTNLS